jgi:hypothetical protein
MRISVRDSTDHVIAWVDTDAKCENHTCQRDIREGRTVHITPAVSDPRASTVSLALPEYHYTTQEEAVQALENAWAAAETVDNITDRDAAYARKVPVKISHAGTWR